MEPMLDFAIETAKAAGQLLKSKFGGPLTVDYKGEIDIVTEADRMSEKLILENIGRRYPDHGILSEESPASGRGASFRWLVDPLDGTTNYAHGFPVFCVSMALEREGEVVLGVVNNPMMDETFAARKGSGAFLNGRRLQVSSVRTLTASLLATGFPYDIRSDDNNNLDFFARMARSAQAIRRAGAAALDLCYVAAGRFDGFWELKLKPWDTAAGWLLVTEAGGRVTDIAGRPYGLSSPNILATNGLLHADMIRVLQSPA
ncbi:MAG: Inositol-1-monophosphatase [Syntrophaceae bacterium PtaU1.Bin231]|nr:MAG: Inositol-1-monophosphatase [Syntrophaceae bacterium PtaU1.Bin231]